MTLAFGPDGLPPAPRMTVVSRVARMIFSHIKRGFRVLRPGFADRLENTAKGVDWVKVSPGNTPMTPGCAVARYAALFTPSSYRIGADSQ